MVYRCKEINASSLRIYARDSEDRPRCFGLQVKIIMPLGTQLMAFASRTVYHRSTDFHLYSKTGHRAIVVILQFITMASGTFRVESSFFPIYNSNS